MSVTVSIIMPAFNAGKFIDQAIQSVLDQSFTNWELLICDDGSTDNSAEIIKSFSAVDERIKYLQNEKTRGAPGARNTALAHSSGRYIAFLDADDTWLPLKLEKQIKFMENNQSSFVFGYCENMSEQGDFLSITKAPAVVSFWKLSLSNFIPCLTVIYDSHMLGKVKQPNIEKRNDFALWLKILRENKELEARCYPEVVARYRVNSYGLSANKLSGIKYFYRCLRQYAGLGIGSASFHTFSAIGFKALKSLSPQLYNFVVTKLL